ncbi:MAG TPA: hypothetical protein DEA96_05505 [Leptospiraceae bacterium]|nr:hypothetical protein [Spirochaetaceae bacterium]HBS04398.1 hypothetical protein [Leptospiraceae bacterium]|tara:strand:- start:24466 stop:25194 length:729 start_codon:yes stop_codon:yes gene_type:complete
MRFQLFEFTDLNWYPAFLKQPVVEYLDLASRMFRVFEPARTILLEALRSSGAKQIIDLGSGAGGGLDAFWIDARMELRGLHVIRTDLFPIQSESNLDFIENYPHSVNATAVPDDLKGFRTMFTLAHHLAPDKLRQSLQDAQRNSEGLAILEPVSRGLLPILSMLLLVPFLVFALVPFIKPLRPSTLIFTYLIPVIPLTILWDGIVSSLRAYPPEELLRIAESTAGPLKWKSGIASQKGRTIT